MQTLKFQTKAETKAWVKSWAARLKSPFIVLLDGDLGSGKTQVAQWILEALHGDLATSPSFALHHSYPTQRGPVDHIDLWRMQSDDELVTAGFWELLAYPQRQLIVEWSQRLPHSVWPRTGQCVEITVRSALAEPNSEARHIDFVFRPPWTNSEST